MKKTLVTFIVSAFLCIITMSPVIAQAQPNFFNTQEIEYYEDGSYFITTIENSIDSISINSTSVTKSKTGTFYSASGSALWYVKVTGKFTYGNGTSTCTSSSVSAASYHSSWKISSKSSSKSGNTASATATAKQYQNGAVVQTKSRTVSLSCSASGKFS